MDAESAQEGENHQSPDHNSLRTAKGLIMLDEEVIPVPGLESLDLFGIHYLQQLNSWLYVGLGVHAPLLYGNYGGFMAFDATIHAQHAIAGDLFMNAGVSFGGGGGGSSVNQSMELTGTGGFVKSYAGVGYDFSGFSAGVNYDHFRFVNALINHSQVGLFVQTPVSYEIGSYASAGHEPGFSFSDNEENILALEFNNLFQLKPKGQSKQTIQTLSMQFSHFLNENSYLFLEAEGGYKGLPLYNQVLGGIGNKVALTPHVNLFGQLGVGSGGYSPVEIDTGTGLLVYPKISAEYLMNKNFGLALSSGYLFAPKGTSKNVTLGLAINYHPSSAEESPVFKGFRINVFQQTEFDVRIGNKKRSNINLLSYQLDNIINDNWYVPVQIGAAYNEFLGYPGYGEALIGLGVQNSFSATDSFQNFFQILTGSNVHGIVVKPSVGFHYSQSDNIAFNGQFGKTVSLNKLNLYPHKLRLNAYHIGLGVTYRFSLL